MKKCLISIAVMIFGWHGINGQDLGSFRSQKPFDWRGSFQAGSFSSIRNTNEPGTDPFSWYVNANASLSFYGVTVPFSVAYRDRRSNFYHPFTRFSLSPYYKWARIYLGHSQMHFNPYAISGMSVFGAGVELNPGKFRFSVLNGTVQNPKIAVDSVANISSWINPYERKIFAVKVGFGNQSNHTDLIVMKGIDKELHANAPDSLFIPKAANVVLGLESQYHALSNKVRFSLNLASSAFTRDVNSNPLSVEEEEMKWLNVANRFTKVNNSTRLNLAGDASVNINLGQVQVGGKVQRIDPLYESFGIYYLRDDQENYTLNTSFYALQGKVNASGSYGVMRNNVLRHRAATTLQRIYQVAASINPAPWGGINIQYSNFNFDQQAGLIAVDDSLRFAQINGNTTISPYISLNQKLYSHFIQFQYSKQKITDLSSDIYNPTDVVVNMVGLNYNLKNKPNKYGVNASLNYFTNNYGEVTTGRTGITLGGQKSWSENAYTAKARVNVSKNTADGESDGSQFSVTAIGTARLNKRYMFNIQATYTSRNSERFISYKETRINTSINIPIK